MSLRGAGCARLLIRATKRRQGEIRCRHPAAVLPDALASRLGPAKAAWRRQRLAHRLRPDLGADRRRNNFPRMVLELDRRYPGLGRQIEESVAVAIDGEIFQDAYLVPLKPESEIYLIPKIGGG